MTGARAAWLPDGRRLHLNHGPIDLVLEAFGEPAVIRDAYSRAVARFDGLLEELVAELPDLRRADPAPLRGPVARVMARAVRPFRPAFITPMAAVAGAVADAVLAAMTDAEAPERAYVNNGGDIAFHLGRGQCITAAIAARAGHADRVTITHADPVRGLATSGWRGRSWSFGIADAVTVLARTGAEADAAATMIANAVDLPGHPAIARMPANDLQCDTDLGARRVTTAVGPLTPAEVARALDAGATRARALVEADLVAGAALFLAGEVRLVGTIPAASRCEELTEHAVG